jgi:murein DD-endopeptidase MepM/ murein hydrolase activator NlpD
MKSFYFMGLLTLGTISLFFIPAEKKELATSDEFIGAEWSYVDYGEELQSILNYKPQRRGPASLYSPRNISSKPGRRKAPKAGASTQHKGTDYRAKCGTPVPAKAAGVVTMAASRQGYGKTVAISNGKCRAIYAHLSKISVRKGQKVKAGAIIGKVGQTGIATGCHLHYEGCSQLYGEIDGPDEVQSAELLDNGAAIPSGTVIF